MRQVKEVATAPLADAPEESAPEQPVKKHHRQVAIALNHLNKRRVILLNKRAALTSEIEEIDAAILALE